jgi:putative integral membrane protein (TIGR02587 family)
MSDSAVQALRNQIRGITGALLVVGLTFHYTMETWWWGQTLPLAYLSGYVLVGLGVIVLLARQIGFHEGEDQGDRPDPRWYGIFDFAEILIQSLVAAYTILLLIGIIDLGSSLHHVVRLGFMEVVPLGFGAALSNRFLGSEDPEDAGEGRELPQSLSVFVVGSLFISATIAPTQEMELISAHMGWPRHLALIAVTLVLIYLILYELEFQGHHTRVQREKRYQVGTVFVVYVVGVTVSFLLLLGFGHFIDATVALVYQETVVLAFPAALGCAAGEVVI